MSALVTCGGLDVLSMEIHMPARAWWWARGKLDGKLSSSGQVTISAAGGLSLTGTVLSPLSGVFLGSALVQIVGGAGGLSKIVQPRAFQNAIVRDALSAILRDAGESISSSIAQQLLSLQLAQWSISAQPAAKAIDLLAAFAGAETWRVLSDGTVWMGAESWPQQSLPPTADILTRFPDEGRFEIGCETPALLPGVFLSDASSNIGAVDHFIEFDQVRTWAWAA